MFSPSFMKFLIEYQEKECADNENKTVKEIEFKPVKFKTEARVQISIKDYY